MGHITLTAFLSLDGVMQDPHLWSFDYQSTDTGDYNREVLFGAETLLLGRETYEGFAAAWPDREDEEGFADKMNGMKKVVVSSTLASADWQNSELATGDPADVARELAARDDGDILVWGSARLGQALTAAGVVDRYELLVSPVLLGAGKRLFAEDGVKRPLRTAKVTPLSGGMTALRLEPAR